MSLEPLQKDPQAQLIYAIDWTPWLNGDTLTASSWTIPPGITGSGATFDATRALIMLSGGTDGSDYELLNHITTATGQQDERTILIQVRNRDSASPEDADRALALEMLAEIAELAVAPVLTENEVNTILERAKYASTWKLSTHYDVGDIVLPPIRNGHRYVAVGPGTSRSTDLGYYYWPVVPGEFLYDGIGSSTSGILVWQENGADYFPLPGTINPFSSLYNLRAAAYECWLMKQRRASQFMQTGDIRFDQIYDHCKEMAAYYSPPQFGAAALVRG